MGFALFFYKLVFCILENIKKNLHTAKKCIMQAKLNCKKIYLITGVTAFRS